MPVPQLPTLIYSNRLESLADHLKGALYSYGSPFDRRMVVVPSPAMRSWLWEWLAKEEGIVAGVEGEYLNPTLHAIAQLLLGNENSFLPSPLTLSLSIEKELKQKLREFSCKKAPESLQSILSYLSGGKEFDASLLSRKQERRIVTLSSQLADLFKIYGEYGKELLPLLEKDQLGWQGDLWNSLFDHKFSQNGDYPYRLFERAMEKLPEKASLLKGIHLHLFGVSFFSSLHQRFIAYLSSYIPITFYILSPCSSYWEDLRSQKEVSKLHLKSEERGIAIREREALDSLIQEHNSLLGNWGRMGREMSTRLLDMPSRIQELYCHSGPLVFSHHLELLEEASENNPKSLQPTLLHTLQNDLLLMSRPPENEYPGLKAWDCKLGRASHSAQYSDLKDPALKGRVSSIEDKKISFPSSDHSIQLHVASTKLREIQILHDVILGILDKHSTDDDPIMPKDIAVMAPQISDYLPLLKQVFCQENSLDLQIYDLNLGQHTPLAVTYLKLLSIAFSRWEASHLLALFELPLFRKKQGLKGEDISQIRIWIEELSIAWGKDSSHRKELLLRDHCLQEIAHENDEGTWEKGFAQLLSELIQGAHDNKNLISFTQVPLLQKWISLLRNLREDLRPLHDGTLLTLADWSTYLKCLLESYLHQESEEDWEVLVQQLELFSKAGVSFPQEQYSFISIQHHLEEMLKGSSFTYHDQYLQAVRFCSLLPMRAVPAKVIYLIGLEEESFPRREPLQPLNLLRSLNKGDYHPTLTDCDRYLFLEALLSARSYLCLSYVNKSAETEKESLPSSVVSDLFSYLQENYSIEGKNIKNHLLRKHPYFPFDKTYFNDTSDRFKSYSAIHYQAAKTYYHSNKEDLLFLSSFYLSTPTSTSHSEPDGVIDLKLLNHIARHPLKAYLNHRLGLYLNRFNDSLTNQDESFTHSPLEIYHLRSEAFHHSVEKVIHSLQKEGNYPPGIFGEVATKRLKKEYEQEKLCLKKLGLSSEDIYTVKMDSSCETLEQVERKTWKIPPLTLSLNGKQVKIVGDLPGVTPKGLIARGKFQLEDIVKAWPNYLVSSLLPPLPFQNGSKSLLLLKDGKIFDRTHDNFEEHLKNYIHYSREALEKPSPFIPNWVAPFLLKDPHKIQQAIQASYSPWMDQSDSHYLPYLLSLHHPLTISSLIANWSSQAEKIFSTLWEEFKK